MCGLYCLLSIIILSLIYPDTSSDFQAILPCYIEHFACSMFLQALKPRGSLLRWNFVSHRLIVEVERIQSDSLMFSISPLISALEIMFMSCSLVPELLPGFLLPTEMEGRYFSDLVPSQSKASNSVGAK